MSFVRYLYIIIHNHIYFLLRAAVFQKKSFFFRISSFLNTQHFFISFGHFQMLSLIKQKTIFLIFLLLSVCSRRFIKLFVGILLYLMMLYHTTFQYYIFIFHVFTYLFSSLISHFTKIYHNN